MTLLHQAKAVLIVLDASREQEVYVPEIWEGIVVELRERRGRAELHTDVAVPSDDREARELVAARVESAVSRGSSVIRPRGTGHGPHDRRADDTEKKRARHVLNERRDGGEEALPMSLL